MRWIQKIIIIASMLILTAETFFSTLPVQAGQKTEYCKVNTFLKYLATQLELEVKGRKEQDYRTALYQIGVLQKGDFSSYSGKNLNREDCAVVLNRTLNYLKEKPNEESMEKIRFFHRISDLEQIPKDKQDAVIRVFSEGILVGKGNGKYTQDRTIQGKQFITKTEMVKAVRATLDRKKRYPMSPDGQIIRTIDLPTNAKKFDYILAAFPNDFYEKKFFYQTATYSYKPKEFKDYACPSRLKKKDFQVRYGIGKYDSIPWEEFLRMYGKDWIRKIEDNLRLRLNFDYRTVNEKWINDLRNTYFLFGNSEDNALTKKIKKYVDNAKKNKVIVTADQISVEPSTLYYFDGYYMRCYVKFKVNANTIYPAESDRQGELIFAARTESDIYMKKLKKNEWISTYIDIELATSNGFSDGSDYAVYCDWIYN